MLNEEIVKAGYAVIMTVPPNVKYKDRLLEAYQEAEEEKRGLWKLNAPNANTSLK
jgi:micrococcal nuclease